MPAQITMPQLSDTMTEGTLVKWHKKVGDAVNGGEEVADIETDKATMPLEAFDEQAGTLAAILVKEGQKAKVGDVIAVIALKGEKVEDVAKAGAGPSTTKREPRDLPQGGNPAAGQSPRTSPTSGNNKGASAQRTPDARRDPDTTAASLPPGSPLEEGRAQSRRETTQVGPDRTSESLAEEATAATTQQRGGRAGSAVAEARASTERVRVSPLARRLATEMKIDLSGVRGSGPAGRVIQRDILNYKGSPTQGDRRAEARQPSAPVPTFAPRAATGTKEVVPLSKIRTVIAQRLQQSKQQIPHFYETVDADVTELAAMRERMNKTLESAGVRLSVGDFVAKAVATALLRHRTVNAHFSADRNEITQFADVHLGMAVALENGLIVPVLRNASQMGLAEIRVKSADLVDRARAQRLKQDELSGATFTVSNLGTHGIREFAAIINPPEVGILAIGAAERRPAVRGDAIVPRLMMSLTISADHRAVDGATAADFLRTLKSLLEEPGMMLV